MTGDIQRGLGGGSVGPWNTPGIWCWVPVLAGVCGLPQKEHCQGLTPTGDKPSFAGQVFVIFPLPSLLHPLPVPTLCG